MTINIFERATKKKLRIESDRGLLTTEQLYDLGLSDLDTIARAVNSELKSLTEESFVEFTPDPRKTDLKLQLDILKHVIATKLEAREVAEARVEKANKRKVLIEALAVKESEDLQSKSKEEILAELAGL